MARGKIFERQHLPSNPLLAPAGRCPHCQKIVSRCRVEGLIAVTRDDAETHRAVSFVCEHCNTVLSIQFDAVAFNRSIESVIEAAKAEITSALGAFVSELNTRIKDLQG